jgi:uncharacterized membrane protein/thiol-disulfide isomerase/thioredoxin
MRAHKFPIINFILKNPINPSLLRRFSAVLILLVLLICGLNFYSVLAQTPVVRAVLFYSPSCGHCYTLITEDLPPLLEKYNEQLQIIGFDVTNPQGRELYQAAIDHFQTPDERIGVPALIIGDVYLVGGVEIPETFPSLIETGLAVGGIDWPDIPGLSEILDREISQEEVTTDNSPPVKITDTAENEPIDTLDEEISIQTTIINRFSRDLTGNTIAVLTLIGMIVTVFFIGIGFVKETTEKQKYWPEWTIPLLVLIGLGISFYLTFTETTNTQAVCGPVGDCNTVQQSPYALLFGILPIGIVGIVGYLIILILWVIGRYSSSKKIQSFTSISMWGMVWFGVLFSIYLTFLEPFVIGATCMWCISSAIVMTLLLISTTPYAKVAMTTEEDEGYFAADPDQV